MDATEKNTSAQIALLDDIRIGNGYLTETCENKTLEDLVAQCSCACNQYLPAVDVPHIDPFGTLHPVETPGLALTQIDPRAISRQMLYNGTVMNVYMSPDLSDHDHCRYCGDAVPSDQAYCSLECYYKDQANIKKEKRKELAITVIAFAGVLAILLTAYFF